MKTIIDLKVVRLSLEAERAMLLERIADASRQLDEQANHEADVLDMAESASALRLQTTLLTQSQQHLQQVEAALQRLAAGRYGLCALCGQAISPERLSVIPHATMGVICQKQQEQTNGRCHPPA